MVDLSTNVNEIEWYWPIWYRKKTIKYIFKRQRIFIILQLFSLPYMGVVLYLMKLFFLFKAGMLCAKFGRK